MKVNSLEIKNIKGIKAFSASALSNIVVISGKNGAGKSTVEDAIQMLLGGKKMAPEEPVRLGEKRGEIIGEVGNYLITLKVTSKGGYKIDVVDTETGEQVSSPQTVMDKWRSAISFDPVAFCEAKKPTQIAMIQDACGVAEEIEKLNSEYKEKYSERTSTGQMRDRAESKMLGVGEIPNGTPDKEVDISQLNAQIVTANAAQSTYDSLMSQAANNTSSMEANEQSIERLQRELDAANQRRDDLIKQETELKGRIEEAKTQLIDTAPILDQMNRSQEINEAVRKRNRYQELRQEFAQYDDAYKALSDRLNRIKEEKISLIANSNLPVEGLEFDEDGIFLNETPISQLSASEQIRLSVSIGMALNPELKIILIRDASLLDEDALKTIVDMAEEKDYQVWLEVVDSSGEKGIYLEDGQIAINNYAGSAISKYSSPVTDDVEF